MLENEGKKSSKTIRLTGENPVVNHIIQQSFSTARLYTHRYIIEGSLNSKLPTIWTVEKQMRKAVKSEGGRYTSAKVRRKKMHPR